MDVRSVAGLPENVMKLPAAARKFIPLKNEPKPVEPWKEPRVDPLEARKAKLRKAAVEFEAIFIRQLLKTMRSTVPGGGMFGKGAIGEIYAGMMDYAVAEKVARRGTLGIADAVYRQLVRDV